MSRISALKNKIEKLENSNEKLKESNSRLMDNRKNLKESNVKLTDVNLVQAGKIAELETCTNAKVIAKKDREIINLKYDLNYIQNELKQSKSDIVKLHEEMDLQEKNNYKEIIKIKQEMQCLQLEKDDLQFKLNKCQKVLDATNDENIKLNEQLALQESKKFKNRVKKLIAG